MEKVQVEEQQKESKRSEDLASTKLAVRRLIKRNYPIFLAEAFITFSVSGILMTMLITSQIIFPNDQFRPFEMGLLISARTWTVAFAGLIFGIISDRHARKPIFILILIFAAFGRLINGFAPTDNEETCYLFFIFCNMIVGVGQGGLMPASISYADDAIDLQLRSRFFGIYEIFRQSFQLIGMIFCTLMFQIGLWREYFWLTGIMLFICAILVAFVIKEPKRGSKQNVLKGILLKDSVSYQYKINKETMHKIVLSRTNIVIFIEGIFTWVIFSIAIFLMYPYLQSPPHNISAFMTSILMIIFGLPGAIFGSIAFSKISDKLAEKNVKYRIDLIIFSIVILFFMVIIIFLLPFPNLTPAQGNNLLYLMTLENFIFIGIILFTIRATLGIYHINQSPIIQNVNLPESQGTISAWNQFLETIGMGLGPFIAGILLTVYNQNYLLTAIISLLVGIPSAFAWLLARRWIHNDITRINDLLAVRAEDLVKKSNQTNH